MTINGLSAETTNLINGNYETENRIYGGEYR